RGGGAFLNDRRVRVSGQTRYHDALLGAHVPGSASTVATGTRFAGMLSECAAARRLGSTVLDLAYVAAGRLDGFCGLNLKPWDLAAGGLQILDAGGLIANLEREQGWMERANVMAATPMICPHMPL